MTNKPLCPYCNEPTEQENSLCEKCWKKYLGTHIGGRQEKKCTCDICTALGMF